MDSQKLKSNLHQIAILTRESLSIIDGANAKQPKNTSQVTKRKVIAPTISKDIDFGLNVRAFFKEYAKGMSGPKRFTLVVAKLSSGDQKKNINTEEVKASWNSNKSLLGGKKLQVGAYGSRAKEYGWIDSSKEGTYHLTKKWKNIF